MAPTAVAWQGKLNALGETVEGLADILQEVFIALMTPVGSDPHRPEFGCDLWKHIDTPLDVARVNLVQTIDAAITRWVRRMQLVEIVITPQPSGESGFILELVLTPVGDAQEIRLLLSIPDGTVLG